MKMYVCQPLNSFIYCIFSMIQNATFKNYYSLPLKEEGVLQFKGTFAGGVYDFSMPSFFSLHKTT